MDRNFSITSEGCFSFSGHINWIIIFIARLLSLSSWMLLLGGCDVQKFFDDNRAGIDIQTYIFNYTSNEILFASYDNASRKFDITNASPAGSTPFSNDAFKEIGSGVIVRFDGGRCCFRWEYTEKDVLLNIVWLEVYNSRQYAAAERQTDERTLLTALPGSQWCQGIIRLKRPFPPDPGGVVMHFLPDGSIEGHIAAAAKGEDYEPYTPAKVHRHITKSNGPLCKNPISNPWYLVPRQPHRE